MTKIANPSPSAGPATFLLANDPGQKNYGFAFYRIHDTTSEMLEAGKLSNTIHSLSGTDYFEHASAYRAEVEDLLSRNGFYDTPNAELLMTAERFIPRGMRSTTTSETIPFMLGILTTFAHDVELVMASTWKGYINRALAPHGIALDTGGPKDRAEYAKKGITRGLYKEWKQYAKQYGIKLEDHTIDAAFIGRHFCTHVLGHPPIQHLDDFKDFLRTLCDVTTTTLPATKRKGKR